MSRLAEIQNHIVSMDELLDVVGAMRSLAGMRLQEAQHALPGIRRHAGSIERAIACALLLLEQGGPVNSKRASARRAFVLCAAEHGFVGGFNERLVDAALRALQPADELFVVGTRACALLLERGRPANWSALMATRVASASGTAEHLASALYARLAQGEIACVELMFCRYRQGSAGNIERRVLLPPDLSAMRSDHTRATVLHHLSPRSLFEKLMAEYVFCLLTEATVESIASENAARLIAMQSAHDGVERKLAGLRQSGRQERQSEITAELLDLVTGAEALGG